MSNDPIITVRLPLSSWNGIVNGIEEWAGDSMSEIEILSVFEFVDVPEGWQVNNEDGERWISEASA